MNRSELINDMKSATGSSFITRKKLSEYLGVSLRTADKYLHSLSTATGKLYFIPDVAEEIMRG